MDFVSGVVTWVVGGVVSWTAAGGVVPYVGGGVACGKPSERSAPCWLPLQVVQTLNDPSQTCERE